eukprot:m.45364 g.45364  ORF g.45364 m.45364 type:complete len:320 (-) comp11774_c0_seq2:316-1275(-)
MMNSLTALLVLAAAAASVVSAVELPIKNRVAAHAAAQEFATAFRQTLTDDTVDAISKLFHEDVNVKFPHKEYHNRADFFADWDRDWLHQFFYFTIGTEWVEYGDYQLSFGAANAGLLKGCNADVMAFPWTLYARFDPATGLIVDSTCVFDATVFEKQCGVPSSRPFKSGDMFSSYEHAANWLSAYLSEYETIFNNPELEAAGLETRADGFAPDADIMLQNDKLSIDELMSVAKIDWAAGTSVWKMSIPHATSIVWSFNSITFHATAHGFTTDGTLMIIPYAATLVFDANHKITYHRWVWTVDPTNNIAPHLPRKSKDEL